MNAEKLTVLLGHGLTGWALGAAALGIGMAETTMGATLVIHAVVVPVAFLIVSFIYFRFFPYTGPVATALVFAGIDLVLDFVLVGLIVRQSLDLFASPLATWIPLVTVFVATYLTGRLVRHAAERSAPAN